MFYFCRRSLSRDFIYHVPNPFNGCSTIYRWNKILPVVRDLKDLLRSHQDTFAKASIDLGFCSILKHDIDTGDALPIKQSPRRRRWDSKRDAAGNWALNIPWASPVCLVKKKDGTYRFCVDYRKLNAVSKRDAFPVPDIQDALDHLPDSKYLTTFDLLSGYWQSGMTERANERSAFCTRRVLFQFKRMPFGLAGATSSICRLMPIALRDLLWVICLCYIDDIIIFFPKPDRSFCIVWGKCLTGLEVGLKVKPSTCASFQRNKIFRAPCIRTQHWAVAIIKNWPTPHCLRDVRTFFGLASYYRRFVKGFATIAEQLVEWHFSVVKHLINRRNLIGASLEFPWPMGTRPSQPAVSWVAAA